MIAHQLHGHTGGNMAGTKRNIYRVEMFFFVYADDDDAARDRVTSVLPKGDLDIAWAWQSTTLENKGDASE